MARRGRLGIYRDILLSLAMSENRTEKPTRLMNKANIAWKPLKDNLAKMMELGLVEAVDVTPLPRFRRVDQRSKIHYRITAKGTNVLRIADMLFEYIDGIRPDVNLPPDVLRVLLRASTFGVKGFESLLERLSPAGRLLEAPEGMEEHVKLPEVDRKIIEVDYAIVTEVTFDGAYLCPIDGCSSRSYSEAGIKQHIK